VPTVFGSFCDFFWYCCGVRLSSDFSCVFFAFEVVLDAPLDVPELFLAALFEDFAAPAAAPVVAAAAGAPPVLAWPPRLITCGVVCAAWSLLPA